MLRRKASIASKNNRDEHLCEVLNIGENALMMVDDLAFELDEIRSELPNVVCIEAAAYATLPDLPHVNPAVISRDASERRLRYQEEVRRKSDQERFEGAADAFLEGLGMRMRIARATEDDLERAEELTRRTNQMNTTGIPYDRDTLHALLDDERFATLICDVDDGTHLPPRGLPLGQRGGSRPGHPDPASRRARGTRGAAVYRDRRDGVRPRARVVCGTFVTGAAELARLALRDAGPNVFAKRMLAIFDMPVGDYMRELARYQPGAPMDPPFRRALLRALDRSGLSDADAAYALADLEHGRTLQTSGHLTLSNGPGFFGIDWLSTLAATGPIRPA